MKVFESDEPTLPGMGPRSGVFDLDWSDDEECVFRRERDGRITPLSSTIQLQASEREQERNMSKVELAEQTKDVWRFSVFFRWYDMWIGAFWDRKNRVLYVCPVPMLGVKISVPNGWFRSLIKRLRCLGN